MQRRGAGHLLLPHPVAVLAHAGGQIRFAFRSGREVEPQNNGNLFGRQSWSHFPGVAPADDDRLHLELRREVQGAVDLVGRIGFERDRELPVECRPERFEARVGGGALPGLPAGVVGGPLPLQPAGVEHRLPGVSDDPHQRGRVLGTDDPTESRVRCDRTAEDRVTRDGAAEAHQGARAGHVTAIGHNKVSREADLPPRRNRLLIQLESRLDGELGGQPLAVVGLGGDERVGADVLGRGRSAKGPAQCGVVATGTTGIEEAGVHGQPLTLGNERVRRDREVGSDGDDQPVADDHRGLRQNRPGLDHDPRVTDGVSRGAQVGGVLGRDRDTECGGQERTE